jgi:hypothetical protein
MMFTEKDIRKVSGTWYTVTITSWKDHFDSQWQKDGDGKVKESLYVDLFRSPYDDRDWLISTRNDVYLVRDAAQVVDALAWRRGRGSIGMTLPEMKQRLVAWANKLEVECK